MNETRIYAAISVVLAIVIIGLFVATRDDDNANSNLGFSDVTSTTLVGASTTAISQTSTPESISAEQIIARYAAIEAEWDQYIRGKDAAGNLTDLPNKDDARWGQWYSRAELTARLGLFARWVTPPADAVGGIFLSAGARVADPSDTSADGELVIGDCVFDARFGVVRDTGQAVEGGGFTRIGYRQITLVETGGSWTISEVRMDEDSAICLSTVDESGKPSIAWAP